MLPRGSFVTTLLILLSQFVWCVSNSTSSANSNLITLDLYFTANLAGRFAATDSFGHDCVVTDASSSTCFGGAPRFVAAMTQARQLYSSSSSTSTISRPILVDAGNAYFGSRFTQDLGVIPSATWMNAMQYDAIGLSFWDFVQGPAGLASFIRQLNTNIPVVASNANITNEASLHVSSSSSASTQSLIVPYTVSSVAVGGASTTVQLGIVGILAETASQTATTGNIFIPTQLAASEIVVRQAIAQLRRQNPSVSAIVAVCSSNFCSDYLQNIPDISVMVVTTCSSTTTGPLSSTSLPLTINDAFSRRVAVCMDSAAQTLGHVAATLDLSSAPYVNVASLNNSPILLTNTTASDSTMLQLWTQYSNQMTAIEASDVIGYTDTPIFGSHVACIQGQCPFGDFATDALLASCSACQLALGIGGAYLNSIPAGNISSAALHLVDAFVEGISYYSVRGSALLNTLYTAIAVPDNFLQMSGMRFAYNPNTSLPLSERIIEVQIRDKVTGAWSLLQYTAVYSVVSVTYLRQSNQWPSITTSSASLSFQDNVLTLYSVYAQYVRSKTPFAHFETSTTLAPCLNQTFELVSNGSTTGSVSTWPAPACRILLSTGHLDMSQVCPTNLNVCQQIVTASVSGAGVVELEGIAPLSFSQCGRCSGLGTCQAQLCHCQQPTSGTFTNQTMVMLGPNGDCSVIRQQITLTGSTLIVMTTFAALTVLASFAIMVLFVRHRQSRVVRAASLPFLFLMVVGVWLACASSIVALVTPITNFMCMTQYWLLALAFAVLFGSLFAKTYRLHRIFNAQKLRDVGMSVKSLVSLVASFIIVVVTIMSAWQAVAPLGRTLMMLDPTFQYMFVCSSNASSVSIFLTAFALFCGGMLLFGAHLAYELRNVDELYNESRYLAYAIYQTLFIACVAVPLILLFRDSATANIAMAIQSIATLFPAAFTLAVISIPKLRLIFGRGAPNGTEGGMRTILSDENNGRSSAARANVNVSLGNEANPNASVQMSTSPARQGFVEGDTAARPASKHDEPHFVFNRRRMQGEMFTMSQVQKLLMLKRELTLVEGVARELKQLKVQLEGSTTRDRAGNGVMVYVTTSPHQPSVEQDGSEHTLATATETGTGSVGGTDAGRGAARGGGGGRRGGGGAGREGGETLTTHAQSPQVLSPQAQSQQSPLTYASSAT